jgi:Cd2+/Zn2+-exporting ATPase
MAHDYFSDISVEKATGRTSFRVVGTLLGGVLALNSYVAYAVFQSEFHRDLMALAAACLLGLPIICKAIGSIVKGILDMDVLVAIGIAAAFSGGLYQETAVVSFFFLLSNLMEQRTALGARASIESLIRLSPKTAHLIDPKTGAERQISVNDLVADQVVRVRPGDNIPADGIVLKGESSVSQANITGESLPVDKAIDDEVYSGTINITGTMDIRVTRVGGDTTLGRVQKLILGAEQTKMPFMRLIDRYIHWYVPTILMIGLIVLFFSRDMDRFITMLVVSCPCTLVLATPTAMVAGLACAARLGILVKSVDDLEKARSMTAIVLDKTGTLTTGQLAVSRLRPAEGVDTAALVGVAAALEHRSRHPVARAVVDVARKANIDMAEPSEFEEVTGMGVRGKVDGAAVMVGRRKWLETMGVDFGPVSGETYKEPEGLSVLYVTRDNRCIGWIGMEDRTRGEAKAALDHLRALGIKRVAMVTGDRWSVARRVAAEMGCTEVEAEVLPQEKLDLVDRFKKDGHKVMVVGDGVNDAPALAAGDLGVAMGAAGSDVAIHSATVALMNSDLARLPFLMRLSRTVTTVIWQNLSFGVLFIVITMILAATAQIHAIVGVMLHTAASALVVFNSARIVRMGEELGVHVPKAVGSSSESTAPAVA